jgi:hypothetical protein
MKKLILLILILIIPTPALSKSAPSRPRYLKLNSGTQCPRASFSSLWDVKDQTLDVCFPSSRYQLTKNLGGKYWQTLYKELLDLHKATMVARKKENLKRSEFYFIIIKITSIRLCVFEAATKRKIFTYKESTDEFMYGWLEGKRQNSRVIYGEISPRQKAINRKMQNRTTPLGKAYYQGPKKKK